MTCTVFIHWLIKIVGWMFQWHENVTYGLLKYKEVTFIDVINAFYLASYGKYKPSVAEWKVIPFWICFFMAQWHPNLDRVEIGQPQAQSE